MSDEEEDFVRLRLTSGKEGREIHGNSSAPSHIEASHKSSDFSGLEWRGGICGGSDFSDLISKSNRSSCSSSDEERHGSLRRSRSGGGGGRDKRPDEFLISSYSKKEEGEKKNKVSKAAQWVLSGVSSAFFSSLHLCSCLQIQTREDLDMDSPPFSSPSCLSSSTSSCSSSVSNNPNFQTRKRARSHIFHAFKRLKL